MAAEAQGWNFAWKLRHFSSALPCWLLRRRQRDLPEAPAIDVARERAREWPELLIRCGEEVLDEDPRVFEFALAGRGADSPPFRLSVSSLHHGRRAAAAPQVLSAIATGLRTNASLQKLSLDGCSVSVGAAIELFRSMVHHPHLTEVSLAGNNLEVTPPVVEAMAGCESLTALDLSHNVLRVASRGDISDALGSNRLGLRRLVLTNTGLPAESIAGFLTTNTTLTSLSVGANGLHPDGVVAIAASLHDNFTLKELAMPRNFLGKDGSMAIFNALRSNWGLTDLNLAQTRVPYETDLEEALAAGLARNTSLQRLNLSSNRLAGSRRVFNSLLRSRRSALEVLVGLGDVRELDDMLLRNTRTRQNREVLTGFYFDARARRRAGHADRHGSDLYNMWTHIPRAAFAEVLLQTRAQILTD